MDQATRTLLSDLARQLSAMGTRLLSKGPPGHVDYISKGDAGEWCHRLAREIYDAATKGDVRPAPQD